jgi:hypothetical protein
MRRWLALGLFVLRLQAGTGFDPVRDIPVTLAGGELALAIPPGVHLKAKAFRITLVSQGTLRLGALPPATDRDEAGDPIWRGSLRVTLRGSDLQDPVQVSVTYQPCTEGPEAVCYLPLKRTLTVAAAEIPSD